MKKKIYYTLFLTVCLLLALQVSVFAGEVPVMEIEPAPFYTAGEDMLHLFSGEMTAWGENTTCYRDQLAIYCDETLEGDRTLLNLYDRLEASFEADWSGEARMKKQPVEFKSGWQDCWITAPLIEQHWNLERYKTAYGEDEIKVVFGPGSDDYEMMAKWHYYLLSDTTEWYNAWISALPNTAWFAANTFLADHPEYFWVRTDGGLSTETIESETEWVTTICYGFSMQAGLDTLDARVTMQKQVEEAVDELVNVTEGMTAAQKVTYWDNWLANQNAYNHATLEENNGIDVSCLPWSAASGLLEGLDPVCEGYAKAMQVLCNETKIPCVQLSGKADGGDHMWLAIRVEGKWYYTDPTWDDPTYLGDDPDRDYSSRKHLLTTTPSSHALYYDPRLGYPTLSTESYYEIGWDESAVVEETWNVEENTLTGFEAGKGAMMIILYDENGKMLDLGFCEQGVKWNETEYLYLAPVFDAKDLAQATRIVRINVGDKTAWSPLTALKAIKEAPEAE